MKIEDENILLLKKILKKSLHKSEKNDFLKIVKKFPQKQYNNFNAVIIAAKIARGEKVSYEELKYIMECSPALLSEAERHNEEREEEEKNKKEIIHENRQ